MSVWQDVRYGLRSLASSRSTTAVAIATLAFGIGANTAIFSIVRGVMLRALPYDDAERIAVIWRTTPANARNPHAAGDYLDMQRETRAFQAVAGYRRTTLDIQQGGAEPVRMDGAEVTAGFFDVLGTRTAVGRAPSVRTDRPGERIAVLSFDAWRTHFGSDPAIVGKSIRLNSTPTTIVGVMPEHFDWPARTDAWLLAERQVPSSSVAAIEDPVPVRAFSYFDVVGRLAPGMSPAAARSELDAIAGRLAAAFPDNNRERGYRLVALHEELTGDVRQALLTLLGVVGLVLLVAAANVASLLLARGIARRREMAVRSSLGATPFRLARQLLAESVLLSTAGAVAGLAVATAALQILPHILPEDLPRAGEIALDGGVLAFTAAVSVVVGLLFGLAPALQSARADLVHGLHEGGRGSTGAGRAVRRLLVAGQVAVALVVVAAAGLLLRSLARLQGVEPGFDRRTVVTMPLAIPPSRYATAADQARFYGEVVETLRASGRYAVAAGYPEPFGRGAGGRAPVRREKRPPFPNDGFTLFGTVTPGYFEAMGIPLLAGRDFTAADKADAPPVVVISHAMAESYWPGEDPLGSRITLGGEELFSVVGVVGDVRRADLAATTEPIVYIPYAHLTLPAFHLVARGVDAGAFARDVRAVVRRLDPALPLLAATPIEGSLSRSTAQPRFRTVLLSLFGALAALLAAVGLYGVVSDGVTRRTREIGLRMALGARRAEVVRMVLKDGMRIGLTGAALGVLAALASGRVLASFLFGVSATDPFTLVAVSALLLSVALVAAAIPAWRAARTDPAIALRTE
jgi:predicted permease